LSNATDPFGGIRQKIVAVLDELISRADEFEPADPRPLSRIS
jgi:hypothetical protein